MKQQRGVLLINLGSPDSTSVRDVRSYLREFLMDERVMDVPFFTRAFIVHGCILPFRPKQSAEAYEKIWTREGSPLITTGRAVQQKLADRIGLPVELAMRYRQPCVEQALANLRKQGVEELLVIPLFPHYAMSSYETAVEHVRSVAARVAPPVRLKIVPPYFDEPNYMRALVGSAADFLQNDYDHLLLSFHGLPERQLRKIDPTGCYCLVAKNCCETASPAHRTCYRAQCFKTARAFVEQAGVPHEKWSVAFQSRLGRDPWMRPYTDEELTRLAARGVRKLLVICPAFVADCLETLEEIAMRGKKTFLHAGGIEFIQIPCLNEHPLWLDALEEMVCAHFSPLAEKCN